MYLLCLVAAGLIAGCQTVTTEEAPGTENEATETPQETIAISRGMTGEAVKAILGEPSRVIEHEIPDMVAEEWVYGVRRERLVGMETTDKKETITYDVYTGEEKVIVEGVMSRKYETTNTIYRLFFRDGRLVNWKVEQHTDTDYR